MLGLELEVVNREGTLSLYKLKGCGFPNIKFRRHKERRWEVNEYRPKMVPTHRGPRARARLAGPAGGRGRRAEARSEKISNIARVVRASAFS